MKSIDPIFHRVLSPLSSRDDLRDLSITIFFNDLFHAVIHIFLTNHKEDGVDQRTGLKFIKGMGEDGFSGQKVELFLRSFYEAVALPSGDDYCIGLHHPTAKPHGMME
jgi:hypothetical protein